MKNLRNHRDIKLVTINKIINYLMSEPNYHTKKIVLFISNRNEKNKSKNE